LRTWVQIVVVEPSQPNQPDRPRTWALKLASRLGDNKTTAALAKEIARRASAVATRDHQFTRQPAAA